MAKKIISWAVDETEYDYVNEKAIENGMTVSEYLRFMLLPQNNDIFTATEALRRALEKESGTEFSLPSLYSLSEYQGIGRGKAGTLGRVFNEQIMKNYVTEFQFLGKRNRQAIYKRLGGEQNVIESE